MGSSHKHRQLRCLEPYFCLLRPGRELVLDMQVSQIAPVDAMIEYQSIQQSAGVPGILTAHHWFEPAKEGTPCNEKPTVVLVCFSTIPLMSSCSMRKVLRT